MNRITINPELLRWARERAGLDASALSGRFPKLRAWEAGDARPTLRQVEDFARAVRVAVGYLFLSSPPDEPLPLPDFRTLAGRALMRPSPELLDTIYMCQQRQAWFQEYASGEGLPALDFVGSATLQDAPERVALSMRDVLGLSMADRLALPSWTDALRHMVARAEEAGVLVMISGIVGSNSHRPLDVEEFRGFAMVDAVAPLVFINGADSKAAQMFTLVHELAHLWLGASGISSVPEGRPANSDVERWCNAVAAECLLPLEMVRETFNVNAPITDEMQRLSREFKVSTLVVLRRLYDAGVIDERTLWDRYHQERDRIREFGRGERGGERGGGDFYRTLGVRTGKRFARAVVSSALEGHTLFRDAFRMLGVRRTATFYETARTLGVIA